MEHQIRVHIHVFGANSQNFRLFGPTIFSDIVTREREERFIKGLINLRLNGSNGKGDEQVKELGIRGQIEREQEKEKESELSGPPLLCSAIDTKLA